MKKIVLVGLVGALCVSQDAVADASKQTGVAHSASHRPVAINSSKETGAYKHPKLYEQFKKRLEVLQKKQDRLEKQNHDKKQANFEKRRKSIENQKNKLWDNYNKKHAFVRK